MDWSECRGVVAILDYQHVQNYFTNISKHGEFWACYGTCRKGCEPIHCHIRRIWYRWTFYLQKRGRGLPESSVQTYRWPEGRRWQPFESP